MGILPDVLMRWARRSTQGVVIKDVDTKPRYKRAFTYVLDKAMNPKAPVRYRSKPPLLGALRDVGFQVHCHAMVDFLPYPHMLYICQS